MPEITVNGVTLYYEVHGSGDETIVLNNGIIASTATWAYQLPALTPQYRVLLYDMRGQGKSQKWRASDPDYTWETHAAYRRDFVRRRVDAGLRAASSRPLPEADRRGCGQPRRAAPARHRRKLGADRGGGGSRAVLQIHVVLEFQRTIFRGKIRFSAQPDRRGEGA